MKEQIVAIGTQNFYPEYIGGNLMADSVSRSEVGKSEGSQSITRPKEQLKSSSLSFSFSEAYGIGEVLNHLNEGVPQEIYPLQLDNYKKILLRSARFDKKQVESMGNGAVMVALADVYADAKVAKPVQSEGLYLVNDPDNRNRPFREQIAKAKLLRGKLSEEKIEGLLSLSDEDREGKYGTNTVGAAAAQAPEDIPEWLGDLPDQTTIRGRGAGYIRRYIGNIQRIGSNPRSVESEMERLERIEVSMDEDIRRGELNENNANVSRIREVLSGRIDALNNAIRRARTPLAGRVDQEFEAPMKTTLEDLARLAREGATTGTDWDRSVTNLNGMIQALNNQVAAAEPRNYRMAHYMTKAAREALIEHRRVLPANVVEVLENLIGREGLHNQLDQRFERRFEEMSREDRIALVGDIDRDANVFLRQISSGIGRSTEEAIGFLLNMVGEDPTGLREWRVFRAIEGLEKGVAIRQLTEVPAIWQDIPEKIANVYAFIESTPFSVEELQTSIQEAINLVRNYPNDSREYRELRERLIKELESFRAWHITRITMERNDMDPQPLVDVYKAHFEGKEETTLEHFVARFERDALERNFVVTKDEKGQPLVDKEGKPFLEPQRINLLDIQFKRISDEVRDERIEMNMIEEMTKHPIERPFDNAAIEEIRRGVGYYDERHGLALQAERWGNGKWEARLEELRQYFVKKMGERIAKKNNDKDSDYSENPLFRTLTVDSVWGRINNADDYDRISFSTGLFNETKWVIQDWHEKKTLHGAFGTIQDKDLDDLMEEFNIADDENGKEEAKKRFLGKQFLAVRRRKLLDKLEDELVNRGLQIEIGKDLPPQDVNFRELRDSGFLESVDSNAYFFAWFTQWSNFDSIRIYSRDKKTMYDDDYESVVIHRSSALFNARMIDHTWEFYSESVENRGRAKEDEINIIWRQNLPGKHHYLFPQNTMMVRWAFFFMTPDQRRRARERTFELMRSDNWDFDNKKYHAEFYNWMFSVAVMDMIENGQLSFGQRNLSEIAKDKLIKKFDAIDVYGDRMSHKKYAGPENFQSYLANPTEGKFLEVNDKEKVFYSTRVARQYPWMTLAIRAHWRTVSKHRLRLFNDENLLSNQGEQLVDGLTSRGDIEKEQGVKEMRKLFGFNEIGGRIKIGEFVLTGKRVHVGPIDFTIGEYNLKLGEFFGTTPFRRARQAMEQARRLGWDTKFGTLTLLTIFWAGFWAGVWEVARQVPRQVEQQFKGS